MGRKSRYNVAEMLRLRGECGLGYEVIARMLGCSAGTVEWHCLKNGVEPPVISSFPNGHIKPVSYTRRGRTVKTFTPEEDETITRLRIDGKGPSEIARALQPPRAHTTIIYRLLALARQEERNEAKR